MIALPFSLLCSLVLSYISAINSLAISHDSRQQLALGHKAGVGLWDVFLTSGTSDVVDMQKVGTAAHAQEAIHSQSMLSTSTGYTLKQLLGPSEGQSGLPVFISTTDDERGVNRTAHLMHQCLDQGLRCMRLNFVNGSKIPSIDWKDFAAFDLFLNRTDEVALLIQDDAQLIPSFLRNLAATVRELPSGWHMLHLCPGMLWGRKLCRRRNVTKSDFHMSPESPLMNGSSVTIGGRAFLEWPRGQPGHSCCSNQIGVLPGAPVSLLMNLAGANETREELKFYLKRFKYGKPDDMLFRDLGLRMAGKHFVAREPQLCVEMSCANTSSFVPI